MGDGIRLAARRVLMCGPSELVEWEEFAIRLRMDDGIRLEGLA